MRRLPGWSLGVLLALAAIQGPAPVCGQEPKAVLRGRHEFLSDLAFSPDGKTLAAACYDGSIRLWEVLTAGRRATLTGHTRRATSLAFSPDGRLLASGSTDKTIRLWDLNTGKPRAVLRGHGAPVHSVAFRPDGRLLASAGGGQAAQLWDVDTGERKAVLKGHPARAVAFAPDGKALASCGTEPVLQLWPDRESLFRVDSEGVVRLWDVAGGRPKVLLRRPYSHPHFVAFSADGTLLASASMTLGAWLFDVPGRKVRRTLRQDRGSRPPPKPRMLTALPGWSTRTFAFSPDRQTLALIGPCAGEDQAGIMDVCLWDTNAARVLAVLPGYYSMTNAVAFSPDGKLLAVGSVDGTVRPWDVRAVFRTNK